MSHSSIIHVSQTNTKAKMAVHDNLLQLKDAVLHENAPLQNIFRKLIAVGRGSSVVPFFFTNMLGKFSSSLAEKTLHKFYCRDCSSLCSQKSPFVGHISFSPIDDAPTNLRWKYICADLNFLDENWNYETTKIANPLKKSNPKLDDK